MKLYIVSSLCQNQSGCCWNTQPKIYTRKEEATGFLKFKFEAVQLYTNELDDSMDSGVYEDTLEIYYSDGTYERCDIFEVEI